MLKNEKLFGDFGCLWKIPVLLLGFYAVFLALFAVPGL
jgi:hypothetical protein